MMRLIITPMISDALKTISRRGYNITVYANVGVSVVNKTGFNGWIRMIVL